MIDLNKINIFQIKDFNLWDDIIMYIMLHFYSNADFVYLFI